MDLLLGVALVLGVMILVHEWGHFIAARLFGVRVDVFSIGFGPRLFGWKRGATDYRVSALPLGGYVRMAGQDPSEIDSAHSTAIPGKAKDEKTYTAYPQLQALVEGVPAARAAAMDELVSKPRWQRAIISFAGPFVNLIFPILLLTVYFVSVGIPYPAYQDKPVQVAAVPANSPAAAAGLHAGDKVVAIDGAQNPDWEQVEKVLTKLTPNGKLSMEVEDAGARRSLSIPVEQKDLEQPERLLGFAPIRPVLEDVAPGLPAQRAGLKESDLIAAVDGLPEGARYATLVTVEKIKETASIVGKLFSGRVSLKQLQGPVGISRAAGQAARKGPLAIISLMVLISVNLGILNLLPIPILDGGHILLLGIEGILRRDMSLAFKERFVQVGLVFLLVVFAIVMYNDVVRLLPIHS